MGFLDYAWAVLVICAVIFAAYYATRALAKTGGPLKRGTNVRMAGSLPLGRDKSVALVEIGDYVYVLGVGTQHVERLDRLPKSELNLPAEERVGPDFAGSFWKVLCGRLEKQGGKEMSGGKR